MDLKQNKPDSIPEELWDALEEMYQDVYGDENTELTPEVQK